MPDIQAELLRMVKELWARPGDGPFALIGVRRGGAYLAARLQKIFTEQFQVTPPLGVVDITLYRDDGFGPHAWPSVGVTDIPFKLPEYTVVLVDDVLYTGRTVRAALDAILDYGRPKAVRLAVLVDRGLRELPIQADTVGMLLNTTDDQHVDVQFKEDNHPQDAVLVQKRI